MTAAPPRTRLFLLAAAAATLALWALGDPRAIWRELEAFEPFGGPVTLDARGDHASARRRIRLVPVVEEAQAASAAPGAVGVAPTDAVASAARAATHVRVDGTLQGLESSRPAVPGAGHRRRPAFVRVRFVDPDGRDEPRQTGRPAFDSAPLGSAPVPVSGAGALAAGTRALDVQLVVLRGTGRVRFDGVRVALVRRRGAYLVAAALTGAAWLALGTALLIACLRRAGALPVLAGVGAIGIVVTGVSLSELNAVPGLHWLRTATSARLPAFGEAANYLAFKGGHFAAFALTGAAAAGLRRALGVAPAEALAFIVLLALASESLQRHLPDRSASLVDVCIDVSGSLLGVGLATALVRLAARRKASLADGPPG